VLEEKEEKKKRNKNAAHCYMRVPFLFIYVVLLWRMDGISAVADEAAHCYMRKLFVVEFCGWIASPR